VWVNGALVPETEARVSIYDSALMFGDMVFEMTRSFNGVQFKLREHLERLHAGIKILRIPLALSVEDLERAVLETIEANRPAFAEDDEHRVMINVSRGLLGLYQGVVDVPAGPNVWIAVFPLRWTVAGMGKLFDSGINAVIPSQRAMPAVLLDPKIKSRSRIHYMMANIEVSDVKGEDNWALLLDPDGFVAEGTGDNFFIVKDGVLVTPEGRNILRGISRAYVMEELAPKLGIPVRETNIDAYDVAMADEAFMTGTPFSMLPVTRLNGLDIGDGRVGPVFKRLLGAWDDAVGLDTRAQIQAWNAAHQAGSGPSPYQFRKP
jgi:branched-chain amino acid aminotransferase